MASATGTKWTSLRNVLERDSKCFTLGYEAGPETLEELQEDMRVLVVGAGGLGCEILKNLALSGVKDIHVIDIDTIELSNLNRQFLFRQKDIGRPKAQAAAEFVEARCPGVKVAWYNKKIQEFSESWYKKFNVVIAGLDNVEARRWLNATLVGLVELDDDGEISDPSSIIPLIDGGTEGFRGQARVIVPRLSSCFECSVGTLPAQTGFASCTIANVPRLPEHCIAYAKALLWPKLERFASSTDYTMYEPKSADDRTQPKAVDLDSDNVEHMTWLYKRALVRAAEFGIQGVTFSLTQQVVKNIIPAIAATNALIAASCCNEAFKVLTRCSMGLDNYFMYMGQTGVNTHTFNYNQEPDCLVCGSKPLSFRLDPSTDVRGLRRKLRLDSRSKFKDPSIAGSGKVLWMAKAIMRDMYKANLSKPLSELIKDGEQLTVTDRTLGKKTVSLRVFFEAGSFVEADDDVDAEV